MVDKKLSEFNSVSTSDVTDLVVLYDNNGNIRNGKLAISQLSEAYASLEGNNRLLGDNVFSGNNTFSNPITGSITNAECDNDGNNIIDTYLRKDELPINLFDYKWSDRILNDIRWLNADTFSWQSGLIYKAAYNHLKKDYEDAPYTPFQKFDVSEPEILGRFGWDKIAVNDDGKIVVMASYYSSINNYYYYDFITSNDGGETWSERVRVNNLGNYAFELLSTDGEKFIIVGRSSYDVCISTSTDGLTWTTPVVIPELSLYTTNNWNGLYYDGEKFIILMSSNSSSAYISTSTDGLTWTTATQVNIITEHTYGNIGIAYNGSYYVVTDGNYVFTSNDLLNWTKQKIHGVKGVSSDIIYDGERFVASKGTIASSDGIYWISKKSNTPNVWIGMCYANGHIYLINNRGTYAIGSNTKFEEETIGSYTISYCVTEDGHKIIMPDQELIAQNIFRESGISWYYILDTENTRFKLPRENQHGQVIQSYTSDDKWCRIYSDGWCEQGGYYVPSAANTTVYLMKEYKDTSYTITTGCSYTSDGNIYTPCVAVTKDTDSFSLHVPNVNYHPFWRTCGYIDNYPTITSQKYLYFYVGQFSQTAIEQTAGLNVELFNEKADIDLGNAVSNASTLTKETIVSWGMPDYTAGVSIVEGTVNASGNYTAPSKGYFYMGQDGTTVSCSLAVNNVVVDFKPATTEYHSFHTMTLVDVGNRITYTNALRCKFFPLKGA